MYYPNSDKTVDTPALHLFYYYLFVHILGMIEICVKEEVKSDTLNRNNFTRTKSTSSLTHHVTNIAYTVVLFLANGQKHDA